MENTLKESINGLNDTVNSLAQFAIKSKLPLDKCETHNNLTEFLKNGTTPEFTKSMSSSNVSELLIPNDTCIHIYDKMNDYSPIRSLANSIKISTDSLELLLDNNTPGTSWSAEERYPEDNKDPEFKKLKIPVHEIFSRIKVTQKLIDDCSIDIYNWFITQVAEQIANTEDIAFLTGDGAGKPKGILTYPTQKESSEYGKFQCFHTGINGNFDENSADILISVVLSLKRKFLKNATWLMSRSAFSAIQSMKTKDGEKYIWKPSLNTDTSLLLGYPVIIDDNMPELDSSTPTSSIIFGDFSKAYQIVDRTSLNVFRDPYSSKPFVEFYSTKRTGGDVINFDALKIVRFEA